MSVSHQIRGVKVLKAVSSPLRLQILNLLFDHGSLSYTELINSLKMNPTRDAGRFAYHLKFLVKANLIEADSDTKKYGLTELGKMVIDIADRVDKRAAKSKRMLVRASRFALEEFDANRIANSLVKEAGMPAELAKKTAKEAEKKLLRSKAKYVTAPLVREVVNAILLENGLEEYRHKLTRVGLPVHEVSTLISAKSKSRSGATSVYEAAGEAVLGEYTLLGVFSRDIGDAHLSGSVHINNLSSWILKPEEIVHDLRSFFQNGIDLDKAHNVQDHFPPPQDLESALSIILNVLLHSSREINRTQTLEYFNVFLAPFTRGLALSLTKEKLRSFVLNAGQHVDFCLGLELVVPHFFVRKPAIGAGGKASGKYGDFAEETQNLISLLLDVLTEESSNKPLASPSVVAKIRPETFSDKRAEAILLKAHRLASERGTVYFAALLEKENQGTTFSASGLRIPTDPNEDWEVDTLRTGCLGTVCINLPRIAYECEDSEKLLGILKEILELAVRALDQKLAAIKQRGPGLLPFLMQETNGDKYLRLERCPSLVNLIGVRESVEALLEKKPCQDNETTKLVEEMVRYISAFLDKASKKRGRRLCPAILYDCRASERLAQSDIDRYGFGKVKFSGTRDNPHYSTIPQLTVQNGEVSSAFLGHEQRLRELQIGGNLAEIDLGTIEFSPDELLSLTKRMTEVNKLVFLKYSRKLTYCANCRKSWFGLLHKCPECEAVSALSFLGR